MEFEIVNQNQPKPVQKISIPEKYQRTFDTAMNLVMAKNYRIAEKFFLNLTKKKPKISAAWTQLAGIYYATGKYEKSIEFAKTALDRFPQDVDAAFVLGAAYMRTDRREEALSIHKKALTILKRNFHYFKDLIVLYSKLPVDNSKIIEIAKEAIRAFPRETLFWKILAIAFPRINQFLFGAYSMHYLEYLGVWDDKLQLEKIEAYMDAGHFQMAFDQAIRRILVQSQFRKEPDTNFRNILPVIQEKARMVGIEILKRRQTRQEFWQSILPFFDFVLTIVPDDLYALENKASFLDHLGRDEESLEVLLQARKYAQDEPIGRSVTDPSTIQINLISRLVGMGKYSQAQTLAESLLKEMPNDTVLLSNYSTLLAKTGNGKEALKVAHKLISIRNDSNYHHLAANALRVLGEIEAAKKSLYYALELYPRDSHALLELADIYETEGDFQTALTYFVKALEVNASNEIARAGVARINPELLEGFQEPSLDLPIEILNLLSREGQKVQEASSPTSTDLEQDNEISHGIEPVISAENQAIQDENQKIRDNLENSEIPLQDWYELNESVMVKFNPIMENISESESELIANIEFQLGFQFSLQSVYQMFEDLEKIREWVRNGTLELATS